MANTQPVRFSLTVVDEMPTEASETFYALVDPTATVAQLLSAWATLAQKADAVISGQITKGGITILPVPSSVTGPSLKTAPLTGSRVEQTGILNFGATGTTHRFGEAVPSLRDTVIVSGKIDLTSGGAVDLLIQFLLSSGIAVLDWASNNSQKLASFRDALISFRKRRKQLSRSSFEL